MAMTKINKKIFKHILVLSFACIMIYPLLWMFISSFKTEVTIFNGKFWPTDFTFENYTIGWAGVSNVTFATFYKNSAFIVILTIIGNALTCSMTAFAFARIEFRFKKTLFAVMLLTMMLPSHVVTIPQFIVFSKLGWINTYLPLIVPRYFAHDAFFIFLMVQFMRNIPRELDQAATMDGCSIIQIYLRIILPLSVPAVVTTIIFTFINTWNEFFTQLLYINDIRKYTLSLGLRLFLDSRGQSNYGALFAMSFLSLIPLFTIFIFFQKYLVEGLTTGGIKG